MDIDAFELIRKVANVPFAETPKDQNEVSENNWVILHFPPGPVGAVFNRTGHRSEITELIN